MFKPDQPIQSSKEDILGRHTFAQSLGDAILSYKQRDTIAIGLFGDWGSGKTSIVNLALEHIGVTSKTIPDNQKPIVMRFNPWNFSDQNQLLAQFFSEMSQMLRRSDRSNEVRKAGEKLEKYATFFEPLVFFPPAAPFAAPLSKLSKALGGAARNFGDKKSSLSVVRGDLNSLLAKQQHKIIVVIDDIDRLNNMEIRQIFQLVKSVGDFPNTIYLLVFDKNVVINALKKVQEGSGEDYLEKVIQIPFEIPLISKSEVERLLLTRVHELIVDIPENKWDMTHWGNIYHSGLKHFFRNIRDVTRYINSLRFSFQMVKDKVNPIDFLAITGMQVFFPQVYLGIRDNKDVFTGTLDSGFSRSDPAAKEQAKKRCDEIINRADEKTQEFLRDFLQRLFPKLQSLYGNTHYGYDSMKRWRRESRVCSPDVFDVFFKLSVPTGEITQHEIETILTLAATPDAFAEALLALNKDSRIINFLEQMEDYTGDSIPEGDVEAIITVLMDIGDLFPEGESGFLHTDTPMRLLRLFYQLSHRFDSQDTRFNIFSNAMQKAQQSLYTIVHEVSVQGQQHGKLSSRETPDPEEDRTVSSKQLQELESLACRKITCWAKDGRLAQHRHLYPILLRWKEWESTDKPLKFTQTMIDSDDGLIDFVASFLSKSVSQGLSDYVGRVRWRIHLKSMAHFVDPKQIEPRIRDIAKSQQFAELNERRKLAIQTFIGTIEGKISDEFEFN